MVAERGSGGGGGEVKGKKSGENEIHRGREGGSVCACGVKSHGGGGGCRENSEERRQGVA